MKITILAAAALIGSVNIGLASADKCNDTDAFLKSMPSRHGVANPCTYGAPATPQCQRYIDNWMAAMVKEKQQCEKRS